MAESNNGNPGHVFSRPELNTASEQTGDVAPRSVAPVQVELTPELMAQIMVRHLCLEELALVTHCLTDHLSETEVARFMVRVANAVHGMGQA